MTGPSFMGDVVLPLAREARRATETKRWLRHMLMVDNADRAVGAYNDSTRLYLRANTGEAEELGEVGCDEIVGCCTFGYVSYAAVCLSPLIGAAQQRSAEASIGSMLRATLWRRPDVRAALMAALEEEGLDRPDAPEDWDEGTVDDLVGEMNEGEGLIPWWNDHVAQSVDDVRALFDDVIATAEETAGGGEPNA